MTERTDNNLTTESQTASRRIWRRLLWASVVTVTLVVGVVGFRYWQQMCLIRAIGNDGGYIETEPWGPEWLREIVGEDYMMGVESIKSVDLDPPQRFEYLRLLANDEIDYLRLKGGVVTAEEGRLLKEYSNLEILSADDCQSISTEFYESLASHQNLEGLFFNNSIIDLSDLIRLKEMPNLKGMWFEEADINVDTETVLDLHCPRLRVLRFKECKFSGQGLKSFGRILKTCKYLNLSNSTITDNDLKALIDAHKLEELVLTETNISDVGLRHLQSLKGFGYLRLEHTNVAAANLSGFVALPRLQFLYLNGTPVTDERLESLRLAASLVTLSLDETGVTDEGLKHLYGLKNLEELSLYDTSVTDEAIESLLKINPIENVTTERGQWSNGVFTPW